MVEREVILRRLVALEEYIQDLQEISRDLTWEQFSNDKVGKRYTERTLHIAIEACLDIAHHIISYEGFREPQTNKECFRILEEEGIIPAKLSEHLQKMAQFRNVIVHDYIRVQPEIVYAIVTRNLADIVEFAKIIKDTYIKN